MLSPALTPSIFVAEYKDKYVFRKPLFEALSLYIFYLVQGLNQSVFLLHEVQHLSTKIQSRLFQICMCCDYASCLIIWKYVACSYCPPRFLGDCLRNDLLQTAIGNFFPNGYKIDLPLLILVLLTQSLDFILSLIHIWRCRRYSLCRSRWSPYH